ncbi:MAG: hypothetical protein KatS3mg111_2510 [Pirellulaceae bacterium]|nr:MAG: hypothetical protein KatS3mg111_2510 [Pirellulaceae bacterium]
MNSSALSIGGLGFWGRVAVVLCVIVLVAATAVPGINESHYLPKAKHFWDPTYAPRDLFLNSHDAHFLASASAGALAQYLSLEAVAWVGRIIAWSFLAVAWSRLTISVGMKAWHGVIAFLAWYLGCYYGHWSGEWFLGGFEAKAIAYPCVLLGMTDAMESRWHRCWLWLAMAVAWHPVVGGWAGITVAVAWWCDRRRGDSPSLWQQRKWIAIAVAISMIGVVPALGGLGSPNREGPYVASQIHVYFRLAHHLCPRLFAPERHFAAVISLATLALLSLAAYRLLPPALRLTNNRRQQWGHRMLIIVWSSVGIAFTGLGVDLLMSDDRLPTYQPEVASQILRFYWFRWADVAVPLGGVMLWWYLLSSVRPSWSLLNNDAAADATHQLVHRSAAGKKTDFLIMGGSLLGAGAVLATAADHAWNNFHDTVPPAERLVVVPPGPNAIDSDRLVDWLAVCAWIREHTPRDSLWLTPKYQQTFKWHTGRSEVVNWKDVPQDNASVIEWFKRMRRCTPPRDAYGRLRGWTTEELIALATEFDAPWILVDRSLQLEPPLLEIKYPIEIVNKSFAVFYVDPALMKRHAVEEDDR